MGRNLKTFFISGSSGLGKSRFAKIWQEEINIINGQEYQFNLYCSNGKKMERHKDFWFRVYGTRCDNLGWHRGSNIIWFQEFLNVFGQGQHHKDFFTIHRQGMGFTLCNHHKKHPRLEIKESSKSIRIWEGQKEVKKYAAEDLWIELDLTTQHRVNFYQFKHYPDDNKKASGRKLLVKKSQWKNFSQIICKRRDFDIIFGIKPAICTLQLHFLLFNDCTILTKWQFLFL